MSTLIFPQFGTGALCQFPVRKRRRRRTVVNASADGRVVKFADPAGEVTEWQLEYSNLTDAEALQLQQFFTAGEGSLNGFTFLDPAGNLLAWSDQLDNAVWQKAPLLTITGGVADPAGGTLAWRLANSGAGAQSIQQTLQAPGGYLYCLSVWIQASTASIVTLLAGSGQVQQAVGSEWHRLVAQGSGTSAAASISFGLELPAGAVVTVYGMQVEAQAGASTYQSSTTGGVYEGARLSDDTLSITSTGVNRNACTINIIHANHL